MKNNKNPFERMRRYIDKNYHGGTWEDVEIDDVIAVMNGEKRLGMYQVKQNGRTVADVVAVSEYKALIKYSFGACDKSRGYTAEKVVEFGIEV